MIHKQNCENPQRVPLWSITCEVNTQGPMTYETREFYASDVSEAFINKGGHQIGFGCPSCGIIMGSLEERELLEDICVQMIFQDIKKFKDYISKYNKE